MPTPFGNAFMKGILRSPLHGMLGDGFAVITVTGRKTGRRISTPINVDPADGEFLVVSFRERIWWRNLEGGRAAELHHGGKTFPVTARIQKDTAGVAAELKKYFAKHPGRAKYFELAADSKGEISADSLKHAAENRVIVHLAPAVSG